MTLEDIESRNYTYCQCFFHDSPSASYFLVGTRFRRDAMPRAEAYARARWGDRVKEIVLYPRNYVISARSLFQRGAYEGAGEAGPSAIAELL